MPRTDWGLLLFFHHMYCTWTKDSGDAILTPWVPHGPDGPFRLSATRTICIIWLSSYVYPLLTTHRSHRSLFLSLLSIPSKFSLNLMWICKKKWFISVVKVLFICGIEKKFWQPPWPDAGLSDSLEDENWIVEIVDHCQEGDAPLLKIGGTRRWL